MSSSGTGRFGSLELARAHTAMAEAGGEQTLDAVSDALSKLAHAIGDRSGLAALHSLFDEFDTDGSGQLELNEFSQALSKFGAKDLDEARVRRIFEAIDADGSGNIDVDEFSMIAKSELELVTLNKHFSEQGSDNAEVAAAREETVAALKSGVRVSRTASTMFDVKMQGDLAMLTAEALEARRALAEDPGIVSLVQSWWNQIELKDEEGNMDKECYCCMSMAIHEHFVKDVTHEEALECAEQDWLTDCPEGQDTMTFDDFFSATFQLCDLWMDGTDANGYMHLFRTFTAHHLAAEKEEVKRRQEEADRQKAKGLADTREIIEKAVAIAKAAAAAAKLANAGAAAVVKDAEKNAAELERRVSRKCR